MRPEIQVRYDVEGREITAWSHYDITGIYQSDEELTQRILEQLRSPARNVPVGSQPARAGRRGAGPRLYVVCLGNAACARGFHLGRRRRFDLHRADVGEIDRGPLRPPCSRPRRAWTCSYGRKPPRRPTRIRSCPIRSSRTTAPVRWPTGLPPGTGGWTLAAMVVVCVLWNLAVLVFVRMPLHSFQRGEPDWWLTVFVVPFAIVGIAALALLALPLWIETGIGPTLVEISANLQLETMRSTSQGDAGLSCRRSCWMCMGNLPPRNNTRKATRRVFAEMLVPEQSLAAGRTIPFEALARLQVPADAMHSFKAVHNRIDWKIVVKGTVCAGPTSSAASRSSCAPAASPLCTLDGSIPHDRRHAPIDVG